MRPRLRLGPSVVLVVTLLVAGLVAGCISPEAPGGPTRHDDGSLAEPEDPFDRPTKPDRSWEVMRLLVEPEGSYRIGLPVPVADEDDVKAWAQSVKIDGTAQVSAGTERGRHVFWVEGQETVVVTWTRVKTSSDDGECCAEDFLGSAWSTGPAVGSGDDLPFVVDRGSGDLTMMYRARSNYCGGDEDRTGQFNEHLDVVPVLENRDPSGMWCT